jgi:acyl-CoA dehydrogenase
VSYSAPTREIAFALEHIAGLKKRTTEGIFGDIGDDAFVSILDEAAKFSSGVLAPLNWPGDQIGARFIEGVVQMPPGFADAYRSWSKAGWNGVDLPPEWGGMGLPTMLAVATMEMWTSACMSFALGPVLAQAAVDTLMLHASAELKAAYLSRLVSGEWTATMNLTEPQAGSDLNALRTRAERISDGTYRIFGQKIFISYGEHDLTDNIVHLVLARLPEAAPGTKGISLFLVPKFLIAADGSLGDRNDVRCTGIEHKMGIHASPTCTMMFGDEGGAIGWLVGEENRGLACMFTMMNRARLSTGLQGVAIAERAYQQALAYAKTRRQGRAIGQHEHATAMSIIIEHPDVRRNLMTMKALIAAGRAIAYSAAQAIDDARVGATADIRVRANELAGLLTPITKAMCSEIGVEVASLGLQIHGGMGYIEETGAAQHFRDSRITPIYEGTNGIQAIDLVTRKVLREGSFAATETINKFREIGLSAAVVAEANFGKLGTIVTEAVAELEHATCWLKDKGRRPDELLSVATPYLRLFGITAGAAYLAKGALAAQQQLAAGNNDAVYRDAIAIARFYAENIAVFAASIGRVVIDSAEGLSGRARLSDFTE